MRLRSMLALLTLNVVTIACVAQATDDSDSSKGAVKNGGGDKDADSGTLKAEKGGANNGPKGVPSEEEGDSPDASVISDAAPEAGKSLGPYCHALDLCCVGLRLDQWTGSANQCDAVVANQNEQACEVASADYAKPDDFYDPPVECIPP